MDSRAQSTVVATVLLVAIVFIVGGTIFVAGSNTVDDTPRIAPSTALNLDMNSSSLVFTHLSGEPLDANETTAVLNGNDGSTERIPLSDAVDSDADGRLTVGESVTLLYTASTSSYTVYLVDEASRQPIGNWRRTVSILGVDLGTNGGVLAASNINSDSSAGSATVTRNGRTVEMKGNRWANTSKQYTITPDTTLSVTFESDVVCEIHAVGFANAQDEDRMIRLAGTQNWGTNVTAEFGEPYYQEGSGRVRYRIPIGEFYDDTGELGTGDELTARLVLTNDCDAKSGLIDQTNDPEDVESTYSGIEVST